VVAAPSSGTSPVKRTKYEMCKNFREKGVCKYGDRCLFAHGDQELTRRGSDEPKVEEMPKEVVAVPAVDETTKDSTQLIISKLEDSIESKEAPDTSDLKSD
jgi:hypothetical protein